MHWPWAVQHIASHSPILLALLSDYESSAGECALTVSTGMVFFFFHKQHSMLFRPRSCELFDHVGRSGAGRKGER